MTTTVLFVELLLTGLQAGIWLILLVLCVFNFNWANIDKLKGFEVIISAVLFPIIYPLGVFIDYVADELLRSKEKTIRATYVSETESAMKIMLRTEKEESIAFLSNHLGYIRSRIRISRSAALNFFLITVMGCSFVVIRCREVPYFPFWRTLTLVAIVGTGITILAFLGWLRFNHSFFRWLKRTYEPDKLIPDETLISLIGGSSKANKPSTPLVTNTQANQMDGSKNVKETTINQTSNSQSVGAFVETPNNGQSMNLNQPQINSSVSTVQNSSQNVE